LTISNLSITGTDAGQFSILPTLSTPFDLQAGYLHTITIRFTPTSPGAKSASFNIGHNSDNISPIKTISLTGNGTGVAPPTLLSPSNGATDVSISPTLIWNASSGATSYRLQVSNGMAIAIDESGIMGTQFTVSRLLSNTTYYWSVSAISSGGTSDWSIMWRFTTIVISSVEQISSAIPTEYALSQNYPNPFNPTTAIQFDLPKSGYVSLKVYTALGKEVATLVSETLSAERYMAKWEASGLASGVYFYRLSASSRPGQAGNFIQVRKMLLLR
jgi:hypothetical protein